VPPEGNTGFLRTDEFRIRVRDSPLQSLAAGPSLAEAEASVCDVPLLVAQREGPVLDDGWLTPPSSPLSRSWCVLQGLTTLGSGLLVARSGFDLSPLDVVLTVFPKVAW